MLKDMLDAIKNSELDAQERIYRLLVSIGLIGLAAGDIFGIIAGESLENIIAMTAVFFVLFIIAFLTLRFRKITLGTNIIGAIIIYFILPYNFVTAGGLNGGGTIWMLFGLVYVSMVVRGKIKYFYLTTGLLCYVGCYYITYTYPDLILNHSTPMAYMDSLVTMIVVSLLICSTISFQNAIYHSENELAKKQKNEIEELNKAQNAFFSNMSHEIRTPINTIIGLNEMILRADVPDEVIADAKSIQGAGKMLLTLINDILDMSKMEAGKMDIVAVSYDVGSMLSDIVSMIWINATKKKLAFHIDVDPSIPSELYGDEVRIKQILINILSNAVKYTSEGSVTFSIQCSKPEEDDDSILITYSVADTGMGIKKENIPYLFSTFKRVDEQKNRYIEGTGLGLSIVKQLVDLMGGTISVNSVYTKGSTFVVSIPQKIAGSQKIGNISLEKTYSPEKREHYRQSFTAPKARLLIVDDNEANLMVAEKLLRDTRVQIKTLTNGADCLQETLRTHYDVIFMDHLMPEMDGIECLHAIRSQTGGLNLHTPVVILTANAGSENQHLYQTEGFDGYLLKPVSGEQLERELLRHLPDDLVSATDDAVGIGTLETPVFAHRLKAPILISTDSVSDIPKRIAARHKIAIMPYRIQTGGGEFLDGIETETDGLLEYLKNSDKTIASKAPEASDYVDFFAEQLTKAQYVIHIAMAKNSSKGYDNALEASRTFDNVYVIDSGHLSSGMGLIAVRAAQYAEAGMNADAVIERVNLLRGKTKTSFIVDDTKYLTRAGRLSARISNLCDALMLHPVIVMKNSSMTVGSVKIGTRETVRQKYINAALDTLYPIDRKVLFITYAGLSSEELEAIAQEVSKKVVFESVIFQKASPAISTNCGPGCFGLLFMLA